MEATGDASSVETASAQLATLDLSSSESEPEFTQGDGCPFKVRQTVSAESLVAFASESQAIEDKSGDYFSIFGQPLHPPEKQGIQQEKLKELVAKFPNIKSSFTGRFISFFAKNILPTSFVTTKATEEAAAQLDVFSHAVDEGKMHKGWKPDDFQREIAIKQAAQRFFLDMLKGELTPAQIERFIRLHQEFIITEEEYDAFCDILTNEQGLLQKMVFDPKDFKSAIVSVSDEHRQPKHKSERIETREQLQQSDLKTKILLANRSS